MINIICDQAMLNGFALGQPLIEGGMVQECVQELNLWEGDEDEAGSGSTPIRQNPFSTLRPILLASMWFLVTGSIIMASMYVYWGINPVGDCNKVC